MRNDKYKSGVLGISSLELFGVSLASLIIVCALVFPVIYTHSSLALYFSYEQQHPGTAYQSFSVLQQQVNTSPFAADATLFIFWAGIGLLSYALIETVYKAIQHLRRVGDDLSYRSFNHATILRELLLHIVVRLAAIVGLYLLLTVVLKVLLPYSFYVYETLSGISWQLAWCAVVTWIATALVLHVFIVLLRIALLRTRVFMKVS